MSDTLNDVAVAQYLLSNPDFFIRNAALVENMRVPHPVRDSVSLVEWQLKRQRTRIDQMNSDMSHLLELAQSNESLFSSLLQLQIELSSAKSLEDMLARLNRWAKSFGLAGADIRLFKEKWQLSAPSNFTHLALERQTFEPIRIQRFADKYHYLGRLNGPELLLLLPNYEYVGSCAISLLGHFGDLGMVIFSSRDSKHYEAGQGTEMLELLARLLPHLLHRWIERKS